MKIQVSELIVAFMERLGIRHIFGMPGAHILPVYDSLYDSSIQSILAKHEQGAAFMACGYARASGGISACITTAGPGATNLVTGIANAYTDRQPILIITGETSTHIFGKGGLQESSGEGGAIDQCALFKGITRYNKIVERTDYLPQVLNQAAKILHSSNSGPVLLSFPYNVQKEIVDASILDSIKTAARPGPMNEKKAGVGTLVEYLEASSRPVIVGGYGCIKSGAEALVAELSESMNIPVTTSLKGKGIVSEQNPLSLGTLGVTSSGQAYQYIIDEADLVLFLGAGFNERTSYLWDDKLLDQKRVIQVDNDPGQLEKVFDADLAIKGDIRQVLSQLLDRLEDKDAAAKDWQLPAGKDEGNAVNGKNPTHASFGLVETFFTSLEQYFPEGIQVFDDNIIFAQNFFRVSRGNRYYPNSGVSSLGHAVPAAIGARFYADKPSFAVLGDGGFQMCCMEIMTAVNYQKPLNIVLFNNSTMGLIRKNQFQQYDQRFIDCDFVNPDYQYLAKSFGVNYCRIETERDIQAVFESTDLENEINLIEIVIDKNAFPNYVSGR